MKTFLAFIGACVVAGFLLGSFFPGVRFVLFFGSDESYARHIISEMARIKSQQKIDAAVSAMFPFIPCEDSHGS